MFLLQQLEKTKKTTIGHWCLLCKVRINES